MVKSFNTPQFAAEAYASSEFNHHHECEKHMISYNGFMAGTRFTSQQGSDGVQDEPGYIQSAFKLNNEEHIIVFTDPTGGIRSFRCNENWKPAEKPFAESPYCYGSASPKEYHLNLRNVIHKPENFVPEHSTPLE